VFLFFYLVIFALFCGFIPFLGHFIPSDNVQLILGNYTNVLSALGASIAAGSGVVIHNKITKLHEHHRKLQDTIESLHEKIDKLSKDKTVTPQTKSPSGGLE
ncbi:MAG: hypothetical protein LBN18_02595, partial [Dysgonamonadaceae bacterium]|jgi:hypothetical protein|nr:hypothetical protein [Dysgonamonadaceae bacterium]